MLKISCLIFDSTKTIRLLALNFYEMIVYSDFALVNYHAPHRNLELVILLVTKISKLTIKGFLFPEKGELSMHCDTALNIHESTKAVQRIRTNTIQWKAKPVKVSKQQKFAITN